MAAAFLVRCFVADDAIGQHDVAGPAARPAEADEDAIPAGPVLGSQPLPAVSQQPGGRTRRAVPGRVPAVPLGVRGEPAPLDVAANGDAGTSSAASGNPSRTRRHPAAAFPFSRAFRFSCALMCSFFSASACGLNRDEARSMKSMAKEAPASNLFFSHGRSIRDR